MHNRTLSITVAADREEVFAWISRLETLPVWAPGFCLALRQEGKLWRATTPLGDLHVALTADARTGVVDLFFGVQPDEMTLMPMRVVSQPHGAAVICTLFQPADWPDELFGLLYETLLGALRGLARRLTGQVHGASAAAGAFHPSIVTAKFDETWDFYTTYLGFRTACEAGCYVQLVHPSGPQIGVLQHELNLEVAEWVSATDGRGFWLNLEVVDADAEYARLQAAGVEIAHEIADQPWGDRQFVVRDPNGVLIAIAHRIAPGARETRPLAAN